MVQAILNGTKSQTRRVAKSIALDWLESGLIPEFVAHTDNSLCPYGEPGDVLWVRETFYAYGKWVKNGHSKTGKQQWKFVDFTPEWDNKYKYIDNPPLRVQTGKLDVIGWYKRPSLFMPRAACRIRLQITDIRVERLNEISEADAMSEGCKFVRPPVNQNATGHKHYLSRFYNAKNFRHSFETLWQSINGPESWEQNPWVWVINFERV